jgi:hypothetical protein
MTEEQAREALLVYLKTQGHRYLSPTPIECGPPMLYPVVTAYDEHTGNLCFWACIVNPEEEWTAFNWLEPLAQDYMTRIAPPGEEPLEYDTVVWIGEVVRP